MLIKCLGFEDKVFNVTVSTQTPTEVSIIIVRKQNELITVDVSEKKKNVGWEIVQNVINNKQNFAQQFDRYSADVYIKGVETFEQKEKKVKEK